MTEKKLNKKLVVVTNQKGLTESEKIQDSKEKVDAQIEFSTYVPGITPTPASVQSTLDGIDDNVLKRAHALEQAMGYTGLINADIEKVQNIFVDQWCKQIQSAPGIDVNKVKQLKFGIKGIYDGQSVPSVTVENSYVQLDDYVVATHLKHQLNMANSTTKKTSAPEDADGIDVYMFFGENAPADYREMKYLGRAKNGKITVNFTDGDVGKTVWYFAIYIPKKDGVVALQGAKISAKVI